MIPKLWQNIIIVTIFILILICIFYAQFRTDFQNKFGINVPKVGNINSNNNNGNGTTSRYKEVWRDDFKESTQIIPSDEKDETKRIDDVSNKKKSYHKDKKSFKKKKSHQKKSFSSRKKKSVNHEFDKLFSLTEKSDKSFLYLQTKTINYNIWNVLNLPGSQVGSSTGNCLENSFYANNTDNLFINDFLELEKSTVFLEKSCETSILNLKVINQRTTIISPELSHKFIFTTASIITKGTFLRGFFTFRLRINSGLQSGGFPFIRLQSYVNSGSNLIGNKYGDWPDSGEIDIMEPLGYSFSKSGKPQLEWTGKLWFSTVENPLCDTPDFIGKHDKGKCNNILGTAVPDRRFKPLKLDKFHDIGVEWLSDRMIWYKNAGLSVTGVPSGKVIGEITSDQWWSVNSEGKLNLKPAPFDTVRSLNIGVATPGTRYINNNLNPKFDQNAIFNLEHIIIYSMNNG